MTKLEDFINFKAVSRYLAGNSESIRKNKVPKKYQLDVEVLKEYIQWWIDVMNKSKNHE